MTLKNIVFPREETLDWKEMLGEWCVQSGGNSQYFVCLRDGLRVHLTKGQLNHLAGRLSTYEQTKGDPAETIFRLKNPTWGSVTLKIAEFVTYSDLCEQEKSSADSLGHRVCSWIGAGLNGLIKLAVVLSAASVASATKSFQPSAANALEPLHPSCNLPGSAIPLNSCHLDASKPQDSTIVNWKVLAQEDPGFALALQLHNTSYFQTSFLEATQMGLTDVAKQWLEANVGVDINLVIPGKHSALVWAIAHQNAPFVEYLLKQGADPTLSDGRNTVPLLLSASLEAHEIANLLIDYGAQINQVYLHQTTPLLWAVFRNNLPLVKYLLQQGADPELLSGEGDSSLGSTSQLTTPDLVHLLVQKGADINRVIPHKATALTRSIETGNLPLVQYFLKHGADPNLSDGKIRLPIVAATEIAETEVAIALLNLLTRAGALIDNAIVGHQTALTDAVYRGNLPLVESLLSTFEADPNGFDGAGASPLMRAQALTHPNKEKIISTLLRWGATETNSLLYTTMKMAAHCWTVGGSVRIHTTTGLKDFPLEGLYNKIVPPLYDYFMRFIPDSPKFLQNFLLSHTEQKDDCLRRHLPGGLLFSQAELETIQDSLEQMIPRVEFSPQRIVQRIQAGRPFFWLKNFEKSIHTIALVFHNNRLYVCNRGLQNGPIGPGITTYEIDRDRLDAAFFQRVEKASDMSELPLLLSEADARLGGCHVPQSDQNVDNCVWASAKSGFRALLISVFLENGASLYPNKLKNRNFANTESPRFDFEKTGPLVDLGAVFSESKMGLSAKAKTDSSAYLGIEEIYDRAEAIYKSFTTFARIHSLDEFLDSYGPRPPNKEFLELIRRKITQASRLRFDQGTRGRLLEKVAVYL